MRRPLTLVHKQIFKNLYRILCNTQLEVTFLPTPSTHVQILVHLHRLTWFLIHYTVQHVCASLSVWSLSTATVGGVVRREKL